MNIPYAVARPMGPMNEKYDFATICVHIHVLSAHGASWWAGPLEMERCRIHFDAPEVVADGL